VNTRVYDSLINASRVGTAQASFLALDALQNFYRTPGVQIAGAAALFILLCERFGVSVQDAFTATKNLMNYHDDRLGTEFEAIRMYLEEELK
jgi:hypothetical protein